ncbi:MAG: HAD-IA family hydrolase [Phycisphaeraceae bacterium]
MDAADNGRPIELVCFDIGRVLLGIADDWRQACRMAGIEFEGDLGDEQRQRMRELVWHQEVGEIGQREYAAGLAACSGLTSEQINCLSDTWLREPFPGAIDLIDRLQDTSVRTACLSNTNAYHWNLFTDPGHRSYLPLERLDHHFASHLVGSRKPERAIYEHVERATGLPGEAILFFDDLEENVAAALERGWQAHRILPRPSPVTQMTDHLQRHGVL